MDPTRKTDAALLEEALELLSEGFANLPPAASAPSADLEAVRTVLLETAERMQDNYPYQHPLYAGQMMKPPHPVARLAYSLALHLNPNNHAIDGGRASSAMEKEAVGQIAVMLGWPRTFLGHLTGGGTLANFEALWVARELCPGKAIAASSAAHYTHSRLSGVLGAPFAEIAADSRGRIDVAELERAVAGGEVGTVVATVGTTAAGAVDPLPEILELQKRHDFRVHVDAAYAGYFRLADGLDSEAAASFARIEEADSIVVDPHKHGLQPYGCGCVLFADPSVGRFYQHDSPYTYFSSGDLSLGEISLECSRAGAAAVALWATQRLLPLEAGGVFAAALEQGLEAARGLHQSLERDPRFAPLFAPQLDIVVWAVRAPRASEASARARRVFEAAAEEDLHLALAQFPRRQCEPSGAVEEWDAEELVCLRSCLMKPEHAAWVPEIVSRLGRAADRVLPG